MSIEIHNLLLKLCQRMPAFSQCSNATEPSSLVKDAIELFMNLTVAMEWKKAVFSSPSFAHL
jgi:hypothetical protein